MINNYNNQDINRGVELILQNNKRKKNQKPKLKEKKINFEKVFFIFKRKIHLNFNISMLKIE